MAPGSSKGVVTSAESNIDGVNTRNIDDHEVLLNRTWTRT